MVEVGYHSSSNFVIGKPNLLNVFPRIMGNPGCREYVHNVKEREEYIRNFVNFRPVYMSVYAFTQITPSINATHQYADVDKLMFDIDEGDVYNTMITMHDFFTNKDYIHRIHLSGKGFHIFVWINKNLNYPKIALQNYWDYMYGPRICHNCNTPLLDYHCTKCNTTHTNYINPFTKEVLPSPRFNLCPSTRGDIGRIFRYPNTYNWGSKCYCITLDEHALRTHHSLKELQELAHKPYAPRENVYFGGQYLDISPFDPTDNQVKLLPSFSLHLNPIAYDATEINYDIEFDPFDCPPCIKHLMEIELHFKERNQLIKFLINQKTELFHTPADIMGMLWKISEYNEWLRWFFDHNQADVLYRNVRVMFDNTTITGSCNTMTLNGLCKGRENCNWKNIHEH